MAELEFQCTDCEHWEPESKWVKGFRCAHCGEGQALDWAPRRNARGVVPSVESLDDLRLQWPGLEISDV